MHSWFSPRRRLPLILQSEAAECALACIAMIAGYHGFRVDIATLRKRFSMSSRGTDITSLIEIADQMQLASRALRLEPEEIADLTLPCILHWGMDHFVVLKRVGERKIHIHDPASGERALAPAEFNRYFTGVALELIPTTDFQPASLERKLRLQDFWSSITGLKRTTTAVLALSLLLQVFAIMAPLYLQITIDEVVMKGNTSLLAGLALGFGLLLLINVATGALRQYVLFNLRYQLNIQMAANLFRHLIRLPLDYFIRRNVGDIVSRFASLEEVRQLLTTGIVTALVDGIMAVLMLGAMAYYNLRLTAIVIAAAALYFLLRWALFRPARMITEELVLARAKESTHFLESVRAAQTIKLFQKENERLAQWQNRLAHALGKDIELAAWFVKYDSINALLFGVENLLVIYFAAGAVQAGTMSLGMLYAFVAYKLAFMAAMEGLVGFWVDYRMLDVHLSRLQDVVSTLPEKRFAKNEMQADAPPRSKTLMEGSIEVRDLGFRYSEKEPFVFRHVSFTIAKGEAVAITGPSGCGKTTLLKCLLGLLTPTEGEILVDGECLEELHRYREQIAAVMQEDQLLSGSISDNIACFDANCDMNKVRRCARMAGIESEILAMPMQFGTLVGDLGSTMSGGQKQRVLLARALYREPRILFMDEATSHLDVTMESHVNQNIAALQVTRVLVAHRTETVRSAGRQIELSGYPLESAPTN